MTPTLAKPWLPLALSGATIVALGALVGAILVTAAPQPVAASQPPIGIIATPTPGATEPPGLLRSINAYGAPDPATLIGPVEAGRAYTVVARSPDAGWLQLDVVGSGLVWTPVESVDGVDVGALAVVAPAPPAALPAPVIVQQPAPVVVYQAAPEQPRQPPIVVVATAILPGVPRAGQPMTQEEQQATAEALAAEHEKPSDKPAPDWHAPLKTDQGDACGGANTVAPMCH